MAIFVVNLSRDNRTLIPQSYHLQNLGLRPPGRPNPKNQKWSIEHNLLKIKV